ncbi:MAG TPA: FAD/NAD(P)-binding protein [Thermomicrobiaceae bacterium]|nr:FAD/NAD(P)-binding protein [Thermomicrobiaceae bacterium]
MLQAASRSAVVDPMVPRRFGVGRVRRETHDTVTLELRSTDGLGLPFAPGQFTMLYPFGAGEVPISISGDPARPDTLVHTVRAVGAATRAICALRPGEMLGVRGPLGRGWPVPEAEGSDVVVVAGGIGLAPLRPALYALLATRERYGSIILLYGARTPSDLLYTRELERWRGRFDLDVEVTVDRGDEGWRGNVGVVTRLFDRVRFDPAHAVALMCGPEVMMRFTVRELERLGVTDDRVYLSMERDMRCGVGLCGHCQLGSRFVCLDGPVFRYDEVRPLIAIQER